MYKDGKSLKDKLKKAICQGFGSLGVMYEHRGSSYSTAMPKKQHPHYQSWKTLLLLLFDIAVFTQ